MTYRAYIGYNKFVSSPVTMELANFFVLIVFSFVSA